MAMTITLEMNAQLLTDFTAKEVSRDFGQIQQLKALGPDGFTACFYQQNWATIQGRYVMLFSVF